MQALARWLDNYRSPTEDAHNRGFHILIPSIKIYIIVGQKNANIPLWFFPLIFKIIFNWSIVDLQCCVNFCYTANWSRYIHPYVLFYILSHFDLSQDIESSSLCYAIGTCYLFSMINQSRCFSTFSQRIYSLKSYYLAIYYHSSYLLYTTLYEILGVKKKKIIEGSTSPFVRSKTIANVIFIMKTSQVPSTNIPFTTKLMFSLNSTVLSSVVLCFITGWVSIYLHPPEWKPLKGRESAFLILHFHSAKPIFHCLTHSRHFQHMFVKSFQQVWENLF